MTGAEMLAAVASIPTDERPTALALLEAVEWSDPAVRRSWRSVLAVLRDAETADMSGTQWDEALAAVDAAWDDPAVLWALQALASAEEILAGGE